jgi:small-conductance mechanosensitive channel
MRKILNRATVIPLLALTAVLVACVTFAWITSDAMAHLPFLKQQAGKPLVDLTAWQTAHVLAGLAVTAEETAYAREAERLADHDADQAFASALRQSATRQRVLTGDALALSKKVSELKGTAKDDEAAVQKLTAEGAKAADDLDVAKAQLELDSDELADAQQDLARATGDERNRIQQELAEHEAAVKKYNAEAGKENQSAVTTAGQYGSVAKRLNAWANQNARYQLIQQAGQQAATAVATLTAQHDQLQQQARPDSTVVPDKETKLAALKRRAGQSQLLSILDDRIQTQQQLAATYRKWAAQVEWQHRIILHLLMQSFALIAGVILAVILLNALARYLLERPALDQRRSHTLRLIFRVAIQFVGLAALLLIIFGVPNQMPAILGLTTAGLTVVLQDFIIAFFGWFVLMGKNGIRIGDWVEIDGIGGEVVEVGLFRTALLETGNWTAKGHPTGRRVTFMNSFAIKGQYFNFTTAGQWMWDEITVSIPAAENTYAKVEQICQAVLKETAAEAKQAEEEWNRLSRQQGLSHFTGGLSVDIRPGLYGIDVVVHYVTRASDRFEVRNRLYQFIISLLHKPLSDAATVSFPLAEPSK